MAIYSVRSAADIPSTTALKFSIFSTLWVL